MTLSQIKARIQENIDNGRDNRYEGLASSDIGAYNRDLMFGDMTADEWDADEWSAIVD